MLKICQLGLVTLDLVATLRLYSRAFGFQNAGSQCFWGGSSGNITGLRTDARGLMWWLVGKKEFFQFEIFHYFCPVPQPLPIDWRCSDIGHTRFGVVVADFDACMGVLKADDIKLLGPVITKAGRRHAAIRDPFVSTVIEIIESDPKKPEGPYVSYTTNSVSDIEASRSLYRDKLGFELLPLERLHTPADEAMWGLPGADREGFIVDTGEVLFEIVQYRNPVGRPRPRGYQLSDQGIMNIALASRDVKPVEEMLKRVKAAGYTPPYVHNDGKVIAAYVIDPEWIFELGAVPKEIDAIFGFVPSPFGFLSSGPDLPKQK